MRRFTLDTLHVRTSNGMRTPATAIELISACQQQIGMIDGASQVSDGAIALAEWIIANPARVAAERGARSPISYPERLERILAGEVVPGDEFAEAIGRMTVGEVLPAMFLSFEGSSADARQRDADDGGDGAAMKRTVPANDQGGTMNRLEQHICVGRLGDALPSGPLFNAVAGMADRNDFVLTGAGLAMRLDVPMAESMIGALRAGISHCRANYSPEQMVSQG